MLTASLLGLPPLSADSFDPGLPVVGLLLQSGVGSPAWLLAVHAVSGPELVAKLCTGDHAPFRAEASGVDGLKLIRPSAQSATATPALAVFDNYLLIAGKRGVVALGRALRRTHAAQAATGTSRDRPALFARGAGE